MRHDAINVHLPSTQAYKYTNHLYDCILRHSDTYNPLNSQHHDFPRDTVAHIYSFQKNVQIIYVVM